MQSLHPSSSLVKVSFFFFLFISACLQHEQVFVVTLRGSKRTWPKWWAISKRSMGLILYTVGMPCMPTGVGSALQLLGPSPMAARSRIPYPHQVCCAVTHMLAVTDVSSFAHLLIAIQRDGCMSHFVSIIAL